MSAIDKITAISLETGVDELAGLWQILRCSNGVANGRCLSDITIEAGNGLFWQASAQYPGKLFLFGPARTLTALEQHQCRRPL